MADLGYTLYFRYRYPVGVHDLLACLELLAWDIPIYSGIAIGIILEVCTIY